MKKKLLLITIALSCFQTLKAQNLILNHSCDDPLVGGNIPNWQEIIGTSWSQRSTAPSPLPGNGTSYFYAGHISDAELSQVVDISIDSVLIDSGIKNYYFTGFVTSAGQNTDESNIYFYFNDSNNTLLTTYHLGPYITPTWLQIDTILVAPIGARKIDLRLHSVRHAGASNDAEYDELYLGNTPFSNAVPIISIQSSDTIFCEKQCINFTDLSTNNPTSWQWFFPGADSTSSTLQNPTNICYNTYGSFDVTLIACNANGCDTLILPNFINEYQSPVDSIYQSGDTLYSSSALTYQWVEISNGPISGATNQYFVPTQPGSYFCLITDSIGCNASSNTIAITAITPHPISDFQFQIQPNPNDGNFEVVFNKHLKNKKCVLRINDSYGRVVFNTNTQTSKLKLNLADGVYFIQLIGDEKTYEQKFIVQSK